MKAMIFAAGLGTRMQHLTQNKPKALIPVAGKPVIEHVLQRIISAGYTDILINLHHCAQQIIDYVNGLQLPINITFSHEKEQPLETGGGLWHVKDFFEGTEPFLLHNADIISNIDLSELRKQHIAQVSSVTLAVRERPSSRKLLFTSSGRLCGRYKQKQNETDLRWGEVAFQIPFSGIHMVSPNVLKHPPLDKRFSIIETYLKYSDTEPIHMFPHNSGYWFDIGSPEKWEKAQAFFTKKDV